LLAPRKRLRVAVHRHSPSSYCRLPERPAHHVCLCRIAGLPAVRLHARLCLPNSLWQRGFRLQAVMRDDDRARRPLAECLLRRHGLAQESASLINSSLC
jgi:hypothetical protein